MKDFILLIPYYNDFEGLILSLKSISYPKDKFEVLIVDDGSANKLTIENLKILFPDLTIKILSLLKNSGIAIALNTGLKELHKRLDFKYIARLDCGDTCQPERFTAQVNFMDMHPDVYLLGSWCQFTDSITGKSYLYKTQTDHLYILKEMHLKCSFIHPTVMFRTEILSTVGYYPENHQFAEDYIYFWEILSTFRGHILSLNLVTVITSTKNVSYRNRKKQLLMRRKIVSEMGRGVYKPIGLIYITFLLLLPVSFVNRLKYLIAS
jgi:glycosyltransferase involved in cell wall biosynthesis